jgi:nitrogen-specific signal transduction histidine kinase
MMQNPNDFICESYPEMNAESREWDKNFQQTSENLQKGRTRTDNWAILSPAYHCSINHEVRNSMNAIMGFAQILNYNEVSKEDIKLYSEIICNETEQLLHIFIQLLDQLKRTAILAC